MRGCGKGRSREDILSTYLDIREALPADDYAGQAEETC